MIYSLVTSLHCFSGRIRRIGEAEQPCSEQEVSAAFGGGGVPDASTLTACNLTPCTHVQLALVDIVQYHSVANPGAFNARPKLHFLAAVMAAAANAMDGSPAITNSGQRAVSGNSRSGAG